MEIMQNKITPRQPHCFKPIYTTFIAGFVILLIAIIPLLYEANH